MQKFNPNVREYNVKVVNSGGDYYAATRFTDKLKTIHSHEPLDIGDCIAVRHVDDPSQITNMIVVDMCKDYKNDWYFKLMVVSVYGIPIVEVGVTL